MTVIAHTFERDEAAMLHRCVGTGHQPPRDTRYCPGCGGCVLDEDLADLPDAARRWLDASHMDVSPHLGLNGLLWAGVIQLKRLETTPVWRVAVP